jgi:hypothetical protein
MTIPSTIFLFPGSNSTNLLRQKSDNRIYESFCIETGVQQGRQTTVRGSHVALENLSAAHAEIHTFLIILP